MAVGKCGTTWGGKVVACAFDKNANYVLGNMQEQSFKLLWNGNKYQ
jgi:hypothetical protein